MQGCTYQTAGQKSDFYSSVYFRLNLYRRCNAMPRVNKTWTIIEKLLIVVPSSVEKPLSMVFVVDVTTRKDNRLCTSIGLTSNATNRDEVSTPLSAFQSISPTFPHQQTLIPHRVMLCRDRTKMICRNCHKYFSTWCIGTPIPLGTFRSKRLIGSVLIVLGIVERSVSSTTVRIRIDPSHANCEHQCKIDTGLACHICRNFFPAKVTHLLPLPNPFLKTLQTGTVTTRSLGCVGQNKLVSYIKIYKFDINIII